MSARGRIPITMAAMTEQDTFDALRKEDFYIVYSRWLRTHPDGKMRDGDLQGTGWTLAEFRDAFNQWLLDRMNKPDETK